MQKRRREEQLYPCISNQFWTSHYLTIISSLALFYQKMAIIISHQRLGIFNLWYLLITILWRLINFRDLCLLLIFLHLLPFGLWNLNRHTLTVTDLTLKIKDWDRDWISAIKNELLYNLSCFYHKLGFISWKFIKMKAKIG